MLQWLCRPMWGSYTEPYYVDGALSKPHSIGQKRLGLWICNLVLSCLLNSRKRVLLLIVGRWGWEDLFGVLKAFGSRTANISCRQCRWCQMQWLQAAEEHPRSFMLCYWLSREIHFGTFQVTPKEAESCPPEGKQGSKAFRTHTVWGGLWVSLVTFPIK